MKDVGGRIMAATTTISPPELVFPGHGPVCPSLKSTVSLSHRCREKVMRQPRVIYWVTLLSIVPTSALQGGPEKQLFIRTLLMRPATQIMMLQPRGVGELRASSAVARRLWGFHPPLFGFTFTVCIIYNRHKLIWRFFS